MALAMFSTAMVTKPSATASGVRPSPISAASAANFSRTIVGVERLVLAGPKIAGKKSGCSLPSMTLASVTASGPPRR